MAGGRFSRAGPHAPLDSAKVAAAGIAPVIREPDDVTPSSEDPIVTFRCPKALDGLVPPPLPAAQGLPDWLRAMPAHAFSTIVQADDDTVKRCPPFVDAMTAGFLLRLMCDVRVQNGEFTWDLDLPLGQTSGFPRSPISFHDASQVSGTPLHRDDRFLVKFNNPWTIEAPEGYALLFTHPVNRFDLPFTTLTGLVDCDRYRDAWIHFPAHWHDEGFSGLLPKGTPVAQCFPIRREAWGMRTAVQNEDDGRRAEAMLAEIGQEKGVYRKRYRA